MEDLEAGRDSIVRIESVCWDGEEEVYRTKQFSGFVVANDTAGIYVVTAQKGLAYSSKEREAVKTEYGLEEHARISEKIEVIFNGDVRTEAELVGESGQRNLALLKLNQSVQFEHVLTFAEKNASDKEQIFMLSYPSGTNQKKEVYTAENVTITAGNILKYYLLKEVTFFAHDIPGGGASAGGALLDRNGRVIGMTLTAGDESGENQEGTAVSCEEVKSFLDTFDVNYQEYHRIEEEKKVPVLNLALGVVIAALAAAAAAQRLRRETYQTPEQSVKRTGGTARGTGSPQEPKRSVNVMLEYPSEKRMGMVRKTPFLIGRSEKADFALSQARGISREHACIQFDGKGFTLSDLQSTNHTFLNGVKLQQNEKKRLKDGDEITVGNERLIFHQKS